MSANISLEEAVAEYFRHKSWATPRELVNQLYPTFEKLYPDKDTLRRLIHRILDKNDEIVQHPIRPFYMRKKSLDWFNYNLSTDVRENNLDVLYAEGFIIPYRGEIRIILKDIRTGKILKDVILDGEIVMTPNPNSNENVNTYLMMVEGKRLKNDDSGEGIIIDEISVPIRKFRFLADNETVLKL